MLLVVGCVLIHRQSLLPDGLQLLDDIGLAARLLGGLTDAVEHHHVDGGLDVVEDLVDRNFGESEPAPRLVAATIGEEQPATAEAIKMLIECGAITRDARLEEYLRQRYRLPVKELAGGLVSADEAPLSDAEIARQAAEAAQKVYLAVGPVLDKNEARQLVRRAGADIT